MDFTPQQQDRIIEMAWEDRTPFEAISAQFNISPAETIVLMRSWLKPSAFKRWRRRTNARSTKHALKRSFGQGRFKCTQQKAITNNKIAKR